MPLGDGTGPAGQGPLTGRGLGRCTVGDQVIDKKKLKKKIKKTGVKDKKLIKKIAKMIISGGLDNDDYGVRGIGLRRRFRGGR